MQTLFARNCKLFSPTRICIYNYAHPAHISLTTKQVNGSHLHALSAVLIILRKKIIAGIGITLPSLTVLLLLLLLLPIISAMCLTRPIIPCYIAPNLIIPSQHQGLVQTRAQVETDSSLFSWSCGLGEINFKLQFSERQFYFKNSV